MLIALVACLATSTVQPSVHQIPYLVATQPVPDDADDPAIWVNKSNPSQSRVIGTNKVKRPTGGLYVFNLDGKIVQKITGLDRPNNVDVYQNWNGLDIAVCTERLQGRLRIYKIDPRAEPYPTSPVKPMSP